MTLLREVFHRGPVDRDDSELPGDEEPVGDYQQENGQQA